MKTIAGRKRDRSPWRALGGVVGPLCALASPMTSTGLSAPVLDPTRTQHALRMTAPTIDGDVGALNPQEWALAAGTHDNWHVFPDETGTTAEIIDLLPKSTD